MFPVEIPNDLLQAFAEIQQPRSPYQIEKFVVGQHATIEMQYFQCVLELQIKYNNIRRAIINRKILQEDIEKLKAKGKHLKAELKEIDIEEQDAAMIGALREFQTLYNIWKSFPVKFTREQLDANQEQYWHKRLITDANNEIMAQGRIGKGLLEVLQQIGLTVVSEQNQQLTEGFKCISNS